MIILSYVEVRVGGRLSLHPRTDGKVRARELTERQTLVLRHGEPR